MISLPLLACGLLLAWRCLAQAKPVDTNQFGFIREGMSETEVSRRLGPSDRRTVLLRSTLVSAARGLLFSTTHEQVALLYRGDDQSMDMWIMLDKGRVTRLSAARSAGPS